LPDLLQFGLLRRQRGLRVRQHGLLHGQHGLMHGLLQRVPVAVSAACKCA
jgi:hypothetical protein